MQSTDIPQRLQQAFASTAGQRNAIPITTSTPGEASFVQGFPPETMQPISAGGVPPDGKDMNGVLFLATGAASWSGAGGLYPYDATYSGLIGGYPSGAVLLMANLSGMWISSAENNTSNPETGGAGWQVLQGTGLNNTTVAGSNITLTAPQASRPLQGVLGVKTANVQIVMPDATIGRTWLFANNSTGAFSLMVRTASGGGVVVPDGVSSLLYSDGNNVHFAVNAAAEGIAGVLPVATQALTDALADDASAVTPKKLGNGFSFVAAFPGRIKLPSWLGGWMAQWGQSSALSTGSNASLGFVNFGAAFSTCYWCGGFPDDVAQVGGWNPITMIWNPPTTGGCDFVADTGGGSGQPITNANVHVRFLAVGKA